MITWGNMEDKLNIPQSIVAAICAIKSTIETVKKSRKNAHGGYEYASADDVYGALSRKMGEVGLAIVPLEMEVTFIDHTSKDGKPTRWLQAKYQFVFATADSTWTHEKCARTVMIQFTGTQSSQAAESFASKTFYRSLFKLPTGDADVESMPEDFSMPLWNAKAPPMPEEVTKPVEVEDSWQAKADSVLVSLQSSMKKAESADDANGIWDAYYVMMLNAFGDNGEMWEKANACLDDAAARFAGLKIGDK